MAALLRGALEAGEAAVQRSEKVMKRKAPDFDYEKVFWNSLWSCGLVTLTWGAVKIGKWIEGAGGLLFQEGTTARGLEPLVSVKFYADQPAFGLQKSFFTTVDYVEGRNKNDPIPYAEGPAGMIWNAVERYRASIEAYQSFKDRMFAQWLASYPAETSGRPTLEEQYILYLGLDPDSVDTAKKGVEKTRALTGRDALEMADNFFNNYGPVLPVAIVGLNVALEYIKKRKNMPEAMKLLGDSGIALGAISAIQFVPSILTTFISSMAKTTGGGLTV